MNRTIITIDAERCNGCGACVTGCYEGALHLIDGKAAITNDSYCDGLGACLDECPTNAIRLEEREVDPYNEYAVMKQVAAKGEQNINAHLNHLKSHGKNDLVNQGLDYLQQHGIPNDLSPQTPPAPNTYQYIQPSKDQTSELRQFPIQLRLLNPLVGFLQGADLLLAADCTAFASGEFHQRFLRGKIVTIACPKLDDNATFYIEKLSTIIDTAQIDTLTVLIMDVPCCKGLLKIAQAAKEKAERNVPLKAIILTVHGQVKSEAWI